MRKLSLKDLGIDLSQFIKLPTVPVDTTIKIDDSVFKGVALVGGLVLSGVLISFSMKGRG